MDKTPPNDTYQDTHQDAVPVGDAVFEKTDADIKKDAKREQLLLNLKKGRETARQPQEKSVVQQAEEARGG